jgi:hypothetical protein
MNEALQAQLAEDLDDIQAIHARLATHQEPLSYEAALKELQANGSVVMGRITSLAWPASTIA